MDPSTLAQTEPLHAQAYEQAARKNVLAAMNPQVFFGYFSVCADGVGYGGDSTYPGLDWGQSAEALLWLGRVPEVLASWDYVRSFQRENGQLPFAICPEVAGRTVQVEGHPLTIEPNGGIFRHWCPGDPLRALANVTFLTLADAIHQHTHDGDWLKDQAPRLHRAATFLASLTDEHGRVSGAGFYVERPNRVEFDGVTQCATAHALRLAARLLDAANNPEAARQTAAVARKITACFQRTFWVGDHFAEYIHPQRGVVANHGLTDVDWAAIACGVASGEQVQVLWPQLRSEQRFYYGGMPTGIATLPHTFEDWEFPIADRKELAAMGRVWYLECQARWRMGDREGILESLRRVAQVGKDAGWYWRERYFPSSSGPVPGGAEKYCEYPANFIRIVHRFC